MGHGKEANNLQELKYHVLELGWRVRARSDQGRNGSYSRYAGGVKSHGEDMSALCPDSSSLRGSVRSITKRTPAEAIGSKGGVRDGEKDERGVKRRSGQGRYKLAVVDLWQSCSVTGCGNPNLLLASHIIAHKNSESHERLDPHNGLLLTPNLDRLFDRGLISFQEDGKSLIARRVDAETRRHFGVHPGLKLRHIPRATAPYLACHREAFHAREEVSA